MDVKQIRSLRRELNSFLGKFDDCFSRSDTRGHLPVYVRGQLSDLPRKNCERSATACDSSKPMVSAARRWRRSSAPAK